MRSAEADPGACAVVVSPKVISQRPPIGDRGLRLLSARGHGKSTPEQFRCGPQLGSVGGSEDLSAVII